MTPHAQRRPKVEREIPLRGRRNRDAAKNSLQFFARIEGYDEQATHVRGANGIRWRVG